MNNRKRRLLSGANSIFGQSTDVLKQHDIRISRDGKGRAMDNIFIERLWRAVKYEEVYLKEYASVDLLRKSLKKYFHFYNTQRPHQSQRFKVIGKILI